MKKRVVLFPWKMGSVSGKSLAAAIGVKRVYPDGKYKPRHNDVIINWGNSQKAVWWQAAVDRGTTIINHPDAVGLAANKVHAFDAMTQANVMVPAWTTDRAEAEAWIEENGDVVCVREKLTGHSAMGLSIWTDPNPETGHLPSAPLYTKYVKKAKEYRVHVFNGQVIDVAQKKLRNGLDKNKIDYRIRNYKGGWIYARDGIEVPDIVKEQSLLAISALGLDYGAVDVGWNEHYQEPTIYEVNSAPGLTGTTLYRYASKISELYGTSLLIEEPEETFDGALEFHPEEFAEGDEEPVVDPEVAAVKHLTFAQMFGGNP